MRKNSSQTNHIKAENKNGLAKMNSMGRQKKNISRDYEHNLSVGRLLQFVLHISGPILFGHVLGHELFDPLDKLVLFKTIFAYLTPID